MANKQRQKGNGMLVFLGILILAALVAVILGFCTDWYRDWSRFSVQGEQQQDEELPDEETPDETDEELPDEETPDETDEELPDEETPDETGEGAADAAGGSGAIIHAWNGSDKFVMSQYQY